jgi:hypothetical protein
MWCPGESREGTRVKSCFATSLSLRLSDSICLKKGVSVLHTGANAASAAASGQLARQIGVF